MSLTAVAVMMLFIFLMVMSSLFKLLTLASLILRELHDSVLVLVLHSFWSPGENIYAVKKTFNDFKLYKTDKYYFVMI